MHTYIEPFCSTIRFLQLFFPVYEKKERQITILPVLSKIIEKAVHHQLYTFLKENNLLAPEQFGFRLNLSTDVALAHLTENILDNMDNGFITGAVFLDLSKAFDTVDHQILLKKLHCLELNSNSMEWSKS